MITLHGKTYTVARDETGPVVLIQHPNRGRATIWRLASARDSLRVIAGLKLCPLRIARVSGGILMTLFDRNGEISVYLHEPSGDHIVIRYRVDPKGGEYAAVLPHGSIPWDHAVSRAMRASAFM